MLDLFAPQIDPEAVYSNRLRIHRVVGDGMYPRLRDGFDFVLIKPVGEGTYLFHNGIGPELYCVASTMDGKRGLRLFRDNPHYSDGFMTLEDFEGCVLGIVVADVKIRNSRMLAAA
ncbi:hypothetical protein [Phyllobacterium leguminum]|uniref:Peptidase S24-like protein n=1 Tax=Phyllobacterium leguminum TaxID=314237 RepID=A0A318T5R7_9HYPH|nr:hypothetical protein [Phyllobacterium leguminum]PYE89577.1 hypothetical protein C7477_10385 [Phyllobacterium leguminum]